MTWSPHGSRPKIDPRLEYLLSLDETELADLKRREGAAAESWATRRRERADEDEFPLPMPAPLTTGLFLPPLADGPEWRVGRAEPYASAFVASDASPRDLARLGVVVRNQTCDYFTA